MIGNAYVEGLFAQYLGEYMEALTPLIVPTEDIWHDEVSFAEGGYTHAIWFNTNYPPEQELGEAVHKALEAFTIALDVRGQYVAKPGKRAWSVYVACPDDILIEANKRSTRNQEALRSAWELGAFDPLD